MNLGKTFAVAILASIATSSAPVKAAPGSLSGDSPQIAVGTPYPKARAELIRQGWRPVSVLDTGDGYPLCEFNATICKAFPELTSCAGAGRAYCSFLYQRRKDDRYWFVTTEGEPGDPPDMGRLKYVRSGLESRTGLQGLTILTPAGAKFKFVYPKRREPVTSAPAEPEGPIPLCSDVPPGKLPCWVKPPTGDQRE